MTATQASSTVAPALDVRGISKTYSGVTVLRNAEMCVESGTIRALLGQNGSGKSTLIRILAGDIDPDPGGSVAVNGVPLRLGNPRRSKEAGLRFVHQNLCIIGALNTMENIALTNGYIGGRKGAINWGAERQRAQRLLAKFALDIDVDAPLAQYRRVEHAIVAVARALEEDVGPIRVLVLDEPTASLPPLEVQRLFGVLRHVRELGVAIVYVTHRMDEVFQLADDITILRDGCVRMTCPTASTSPEAVAEEVIGAHVERLGRAGSRPRAVTSREVPPVVSLPGITGDGKKLFEVFGLTSKLLRGVSFAVGGGEVVGIAGLAGSGREDVGAAVVGAIPATAESIRIGGVTVRGTLTPQAAISHGVAYVRSCWQNGGSIARMTVRENLTLGSLSLMGGLGWLSVNRERSVTERWAARLRIVKRSCDQQLAELSGGNQQKVIIAKWLNANARVLIFDEPTAGVDVGAKRELHALVREFVSDPGDENGKAVVIASSDTIDFIGICDRVLVMRDGEICEELVGEEVDEQRIQRSIMGVAQSLRLT
jgi:ribose transport system ATP-binding protein